METLSYRFLEALARSRDHLYALALMQGGGSGGAEAVLERAVRGAFAQAAANDAVDVAGAVERGLVTQTSGDGGAGTSVLVESMMPADVWARLAAAVQLEAARSAKAGMLADDSVLLKPDPILAPRRKMPKVEDEAGTAVRPATFILVALGVGVVLTIYILSRGAGSSPKPPSAPSATTGAAHP